MPESDRLGEDQEIGAVEALNERMLNGKDGVGFFCGSADFVCTMIKRC